jgi:hypothetical protein
MPRMLSHTDRGVNSRFHENRKLWEYSYINSAHSGGLGADLCPVRSAHISATNRSWQQIKQLFNQVIPSLHDLFS